MANPKEGAAITMAVSLERMPPEKIRAIFDEILEPDLMRKSMLELWNDPSWVEARVSGVLKKTAMPCIDIHWKPVKDGGVDLGMMMTYYIDPINRQKLKVDGCDILTIWTYDVQLQGENAEKYPVPLEIFKNILNIVQPAFAIVDDYAKSVRKRAADDLRKFGWGATVYGPEMVKQLGRDKLLTTPAYQIEELPWGGVWVQAAKNPFEAVPQAKKAVEKHLDLKSLFS